jgi:hypothetical protein
MVFISGGIIPRQGKDYGEAVSVLDTSEGI